MKIGSSSKQNPRKHKAKTVVGGAVAGSIVKNLTKFPAQIINPKIMAGMKKMNSGLSSDEFIQAENAIKETIRTSGLQEKGVGIVKATKENTSIINEIMIKEADSSITRFLPKKVKELIGKANAKQMLSGENACFAPKSNKIVMPEKELALAVFHEAGHAMNANLSHIGKALQKCRSLMLLSLPISMIALWKTKKQPDEKPKNKVDKATTFIKENAGKLTFATFIPTLIEEGLATYKGNKAAKNLLSRDLAKKVAKSNALGFSTYLLVAILSGVGMYLGTKTKDKAVESKQNNK